MTKYLFTAIALVGGSVSAQVKVEPPARGASFPTSVTTVRLSERPAPVGEEPGPPSPSFQDPLSAVDDRGPGAFGGAGGPQGPAGRFWLRAEYLLWWTRGDQSPPLVTTGVPGTTPLPGALGQPGTSVLYGGTGGDNRPRSGGRFTAGFWLDPCRRFGLDASYFFLAPRATSFDAASDAALGSALLARPFTDVLTGAQNAQLVAFPALAGGVPGLNLGSTGLASGQVHASSYSRFQGADVNAFCNLCSGCNYWVQTLAGFRYLQLNEGVAVSESTRVNPGLPAGSPFFGGSTIAVSDQFDTRNNFYGGQVGLRGEVRRGRVFAQAQAKVALGVTNQTLDIFGSTAITPPRGGPAAVTPAGFLATASNSGHFTRNRFSVVPEVGVNAGVQVTDHLRVFVGYNFLYWSSVLRAADQVDIALSGTQLPTDTRYNPAAGPARPAPLFRDTGYWAQGVSFGAEIGF